MNEQTKTLIEVLHKAGLSADEMTALAAASPWGSNPLKPNRLNITQDVADQLIGKGFAFDTSHSHSGATRGISLSGAGRIINYALNDRAAS